MKNRMDNQLNKRHCMVVYAFYPLAETRVQREAEALVDGGFEVDVICLRAKSINEPAREDVNGVQVYRLPLGRRKRNSSLRLLLDYSVFFVFTMFLLTYLHLVLRYHSVQVHNLPDFLVFSAWLPKMMGSPIILDLHDLMPEFYVSRSGQNINSIGARLVKWQERISCRFADHVITVTELWRQILIERGLSAEKVSVVMNVADDKIFRPLPVTQRATANGRFTLIYHGLQTERYGLDLILQAVARLKNELPDIRVLLHGGGEYHQTLETMVNDLDISESVEFRTNLIDVVDLPYLINSADVGVVPYRRDVFTDGILPTKLMEYVALGIPVIAARTPIIEMYFDDEMVEFFSPGNVDELVASISKLYREPLRRQSLAQHANHFNEEYNWAKLKNNYVDLVERLEMKK